jgi:hypothetical protein
MIAVVGTQLKTIPLTYQWPGPEVIKKFSKHQLKSQIFDYSETIIELILSWPMKILRFEKKPRIKFYYLNGRPFEFVHHNYNFIVILVTYEKFEGFLQFKSSDEMLTVSFSRHLFYWTEILEAGDIWSFCKTLLVQDGTNLIV